MGRGLRVAEWALPHIPCMGGREKEEKGPFLRSGQEFRFEWGIHSGAGEEIWV